MSDSNFINLKRNRETATLRFFYRTKPGRILLRPMRSRPISKLCGAYLNSRFSKPMIKRFVRKNNINLSEYLNTDFKCFNDCFTREIDPKYRPFAMDPTALVSPCDGLLSAYRINEGSVFPIKQSNFSVDSLLDSHEDAIEYHDGICLVFRLCVNNYHRYCYFDNGVKGENYNIKGKLNTVRPIALERYPVFVQNTREYTVMETENFGKVIQVEVGAVLVGKICNHHGASSFKRGEEKGLFQYGGSTVILLFKNGNANLPQSFFDLTDQGKEIPVRMGQIIGTNRSK